MCFQPTRVKKPQHPKGWAEYRGLNFHGFVSRDHQPNTQIEAYLVFSLLHHRVNQSQRDVFPPSMGYQSARACHECLQVPSWSAQKLQEEFHCRCWKFLDHLARHDIRGTSSCHKAPFLKTVVMGCISWHERFHALAQMILPSAHPRLARLAKLQSWTFAVPGSRVPDSAWPWTPPQCSASCWCNTLWSKK